MKGWTFIRECLPSTRSCCPATAPMAPPRPDAASTMPIASDDTCPLCASARNTIMRACEMRVMHADMTTAIQPNRCRLSSLSPSRTSRKSREIGTLAGLSSCFCLSRRSVLIAKIKERTSAANGHTGRHSKSSPPMGRPASTTMCVRASICTNADDLPGGGTTARTYRRSASVANTSRLSSRIAIPMISGTIGWWAASRATTVAIAAPRPISLASMVRHGFQRSTRAPAGI
jgi:hypothetical protein